MGGNTKSNKTTKKRRGKKAEKDDFDSKLILSHKLVSKMRVIPEAELKKVLSKYRITVSELPKMYITDPEARALNAKVKDVIEIIRNDTTGTYKTYRVVV